MDCYLTFDKGEDTVSGDRGDAILVNWAVEDEGLVAGRNVAHLVEETFGAREEFLYLVLVETAILLFN